MAFSPNQKYPGATDPNPNYKDGVFRDNSPATTNNGSPLKALDRNEQLSLQEAIMNAAGFNYNGIADTPQASQMFDAYKAALSNGANLLSNHNFLVQSPDDSQPPPDATPRTYPPGFQIFSGVFANETTGILNLTYIDGRVSFSGGDFYMSVPNAGALENITEFVASVADFDGKPRTRGVSYALVGDEYRITVGVDALEDISANPTPLGSVKFEQGGVATGHEVGSIIANGEVLLSMTEDWQLGVDAAIKMGLPARISGTVDTPSTTVDIKGDLVLYAEGAVINMNCDNTFRPLGARSIKCYGGKWIADSYIDDRPQIFRNDYSDDLITRPEVFKLIDVETYNAGAAHVLMNIKDVDSVDVDINVTVISDDKTDQYVSDSTLTGRPVAYLTIEGTSDQSVDIGVARKQNFNLYDSVFDVHMQTGANEDVVKLSGLLKAGKNGGNSFKNRNLNSAAEVDTFTGGLESQTASNHFTNVSLKSQTLEGELAPRVGLGGRSPQSSNVFLFEPNNVNSYGVQNRCSLSPISGNVILYYGNDTPSSQTPFSGMIFPNLDVGENEFGGINPTANTISGNIVHIVTGAIDPSVRVQSVDMTNLRGSTVSANVFSGGNDLVFDQRREHQSNVWSGNSIYSELFTDVGIWRMASAFVGGQNFISRSPDPEVEAIPMFTKGVPVVADGQPIRLTLDREILQGVSTNRSLYLLHLHTIGGVEDNYQTFIVSSGDHESYDSAFPCVDSKIDINTTDLDRKRCVFEVGYNGSGNIRVKAMENYSTSGVNPTSIKYMISPLSMNFPTL